MDRIYASGAAGSAPSVPASPSSGYPTAGNPGTGTPATKPGPYWYHMVMEELMAIITAGGIAPAPGALNQVKLALDALYMSKTASLGNGSNDFRLTLTSGAPVTTTNVTNAGTLYLTPYKGNRIALYDGSANWNSRTSAEMSIAVPATTNTMYDVFCYDNAGVPTLELLAWTNDTTRTTALSYQNGVLVKSGASTRRYIGSFRTGAVSGKTEDSLSNRLVWNYCNRVLRQARGTFSADRATASTTYVELNSEIRIGFVVGVSEDPIFAAANGSVSGDANRWAGTAFAFDGTAADASLEGGALAGGAIGASGIRCGVNLIGYKVGIAAGYHYATIIGKTDAGTSTWQSATSTTGAKFYATLGIQG